MTMTHATANPMPDPSTGQRSRDFQSGVRDRWIHIRPWVRRTIVAGVLCVMATLQITSMREEVQTVDEGVHLAAGVSYWKTRDFRLNEEHPPLIKLLAALPVVLSSPEVPINSPAWNEGNQWAFAREFLYHSGNDADHVLFLGRLVMVALSAGLGLMVYLWGRKLAGDAGGLFALGWFALDPNFLAHGRYVTTDVGVTLAYLATLYVLARLLERWSWQTLATFGVVFGLAQMTKYSAAFLLLIAIAATGATVWRRSGNFRTALKRAGVVAAVAVGGTVLAAFTCYFGQVKAGGSDPWVQALVAERERVTADARVADQPPAVQRIIKATDPATGLGRAVRSFLLDTPIPAFSYLKGFALVINHEYWGHLAYLNGMYSNFGWWWYFPFALLVKLPAATLTITVISIAALIRTRVVQGQRFSTAAHLVGWSALAYMLWSMSSSLNLGIRHIFPAYVVLFIVAGALYASTFARASRSFQVLMGTIGAAYILTSWLAYPTYTSYFSEFAGGTPRGSRYLVDSNVDWGQDLKRLRTYMAERNISHVCMSYFGQADLVYYGVDYRYLPTRTDPHEPMDVNCVVAISITSQLSRDGAYWWLNDYEPDARIGGSINVFDFRNGRAPAPAR